MIPGPARYHAAISINSSSMEQEAFVYIWKNLANNNSYIGYHKGTQDDGYVCSSASTRFWNDRENPAMQWKREIVFQGSRLECVQHEHSLLMNIDLRSDSYYNNSRGGGVVIFTDEIREKLRQSHLGHKHSAETR
jgi:hypothetical protein